MSILTTIPAAIVETILCRLAVLFLSGSDGDPATARLAAMQMLAAYDPQTTAELRLAATVVSFSLHALEALSQAATPDMPLTKILRLRGGAVSLSRASDKAERRLGQLQQARRDRTQPEPTQSEEPAAAPTHPKADNAIPLIEATRPSINTTGHNAGPIWSKSHQQREAARRITENLRKNQAAHAAAIAATATAVTPPGAR